MRGKCVQNENGLLRGEVLDESEPINDETRAKAVDVLPELADAIVVIQVLAAEARFAALWADVAEIARPKTEETYD